MLASVDRGTRFRTFQFILAMAIFHEVAGHLLITFLSNGRQGTPIGITVNGYTNPRDGLGESGRWLELELFGGTSDFYRDQRIWQDNSQVSRESFVLICPLRIEC